MFPDAFGTQTVFQHLCLPISVETPASLKNVLLSVVGRQLAGSQRFSESFFKVEVIIPVLSADKIPDRTEEST